MATRTKKPYKIAPKPALKPATRTLKLKKSTGIKVPKVKPIVVVKLPKIAKQKKVKLFSIRWR